MCWSVKNIDRIHLNSIHTHTVANMPAARICSAGCIVTMLIISSAAVVWCAAQDYDRVHSRAASRRDRRSSEPLAAPVSHNPTELWVACELCDATTSDENAGRAFNHCALHNKWLVNRVNENVPQHAIDVVRLCVIWFNWALPVRRNDQKHYYYRCSISCVCVVLFVLFKRYEICVCLFVYACISFDTLLLTMVFILYHCHGCRSIDQKELSTTFSPSRSHQNHHTSYSPSRFVADCM